MRKFFDFNAKELRIFAKLDTPKKVQDFLNRIPINFEKNGETCLSPREVLRQNRAHCSEGAMFAAAAFWYHGKTPWLLDLKTGANDHDHVVALFKIRGFWGAVSKTNHSVLRYREPIYKTVRELALTYFHEYFLDNGKKTMRSFSKPFDLSKIRDKSWLTSSENVWDVIAALDDSPHLPILNKSQLRALRKADGIEVTAGKLVEWRE